MYQMNKQIHSPHQNWQTVLTFYCIWESQFLQPFGQLETLELPDLLSTKKELLLRKSIPDLNFWFILSRCSIHRLQRFWGACRQTSNGACILSSYLYYVASLFNISKLFQHCALHYWGNLVSLLKCPFFIGPMCAAGLIHGSGYL